MGRKIARGKLGNAAQYLTRTKAIRKLQLRLSEFRRLCILKGVHPREPKKKVQGANKTYYHIKDINWLMHEPLLQVFRNMKSHERKVRKARGKFNPELAARLRLLTPTYRLDHLVRERYPQFVDALRDLDDALTMVHLFATLPAERRLGIPTKSVEFAKRLALEWSAWVVRTSALRKVFISVKGIYFQAEVMGQTVTWLTPHQLAQVLPTDVDYKVMHTFLEFYQCLLEFTNFKLYHTIGLKYPPRLDSKLEDAAQDLATVMRELAGVAAEESRAADAAVTLLDAAEGKGTSAPQVVARLQGLSAGMIKELAGDVDMAGADKAEKEDSEEEEEEEDSEAALEIDSGDEEEEGSDEEDEEDNGAEEEVEEQMPWGLGGSNGTSKVALSLAEEEQAVAAAAARRAGTASTVAVSVGGWMADGEAAAGGALGAGVSADDAATLASCLFKGCTFFLAREVPRESLMLVIRSFGGVAAWDGEGSPCGPNDECITHQVVDRPTQGHKFLSRHYIQPQWVFDCANFLVLLPAALYTPGKAPPPHLSPFVNDDDEGYTPDWALEVKKYQDAAKAARMRAEGHALPEGFLEGEQAQGEGGPGEGRPLLTEEGQAHEAEEAHMADVARELRAAGQKRGRGEDADGSGEGQLSSEDDADQEEGDEEEESEGEEAATAPSTGGRKARLAAAGVVRAQEVADEEKLKDVMMTRKNRKLYERINRAVEGKRQRVEVLQDRKEALQKTPTPIVAERATRSQSKSVQGTPAKAPQQPSSTPAKQGKTGASGKKGGK